MKWQRQSIKGSTSTYRFDRAHSPVAIGVSGRDVQIHPALGDNYGVGSGAAVFWVGGPILGCGLDNSAFDRRDWRACRIIRSRAKSRTFGVFVYLLHLWAGRDRSIRSSRD